MGIKMGDQIAQLQYRIGNVLRQGECQQIEQEVSDEPFFHGERQRYGDLNINSKMAEGGHNASEGNMIKP
jgi:hypothetical protein